MSENRKCVNCRHNIRKGNPNGNIECVCEITNSHIDYVKCFEGWCKHWAKQKDGKETKFLFVDDLHDTKVADFSKLEGIGKQWYEHCVGRSIFSVLGGTVMSVKEKNNVNNCVMDFTRLEKTSKKGREIAYTNNLTRLVSGDFGIDRNSPETLLAYWKAQAEAGYPLAEENVRYFEEMVRKESGNAENNGGKGGELNGN